MKKLIGLMLCLGALVACGAEECSDGAARCAEDGNAETCLDGQWSLQETCNDSQTCEVEAGTAFCSGSAAESN